MTDNANTRFKQNRKARNVVYMEKVSSSEHYLKLGCEPVQVLKSVSLEVKQGEIWAVAGDDAYALLLLLEIMGNIKPYDNGKCVLDERGMLRHKRIVLPHVFYIGSTGMIYNNMNVLEFLMFTTANSNFDVVSQQERIFEQLIAIGMAQVSLSPISSLTPEYKALVLLINAIYSTSRLIILNIPTLNFDENHISVIKKLADLLHGTDRTLIVSTLSPLLIENAFDNIAYLKNGRVLFRGSVDDFKSTYDKIVLTIEDENAEDIKDKLSYLLPLYDYETDNNKLNVYNRTSEDSSPAILYEKIVEAGYAPEKIKINRKTVENAFSEIARGL